MYNIYIIYTTLIDKARKFYHPHFYLIMYKFNLVFNDKFRACNFISLTEESILFQYFN